MASAHQLQLTDDYPTPFFLISWTAWEAMRSRWIRLAICRQGWLVSDANKALKELRISGMGQVESRAEMLGMGKPSQWHDVPGKIWRQLKQIETMRHRLTHGFDSLGPALIRAGGRFVLAALQNRWWLEQQSIQDSSGRLRVVGDLMAKQFPHRVAERRPYEELREKLSLSSSHNGRGPTAALPSVPGLKKAESWLD